MNLDINLLSKIDIYKLFSEKEWEKIIQKIDLYINQYKIIQETKNISSIKETDDILVRHFFDSVIPIFRIVYDLKIIEKDFLYKKRWIDLGSGAGFPGIALKIFYPKMNIHLAEVNKKKVNFLTSTIKNLKLSRMKIEDSSQKKITSNYHFLVSRAYGSLYKIYKDAELYLGKRGKVIAYKGTKNKIYLEVNELLKYYPHLIINIYKIDIPFLKEERHIVYIKKKA